MLVGLLEEGGPVCSARDGNRAPLRKRRPAGAKGSARPVSRRSWTLASESLSTSAPVVRSQEAKNAPSTRRHGRPIIVDRVTPGCSCMNGSASSQNARS